MKKALLLHWRWWDSNENWLPWLNRELTQKSFKVHIPNLPNTNTPAIREQLTHLDNHNSNLEELNLIIWHSLWCQLAMKFIEENKIKNSKIILVAPTYPWLAEELWKEILWDVYETIEKYYNTQLDFEKINTQNNEIIIFLSDNDPYINMENAKNYYKNLDNTKFVEFKNKWHFNKAAWISELDEILKYI